MEWSAAMLPKERPQDSVLLLNLGRENEKISKLLASNSKNKQAKKQTKKKTGQNSPVIRLSTIYNCIVSKQHPCVYVSQICLIFLAYLLY